VIGVDEPYDREGGDPADEGRHGPPAPERQVGSHDPAMRRAEPPPATDATDATGAGGTAGTGAVGEGVEAEGAQLAGSVGLPPPEPTGDERVDVALTRFAELTATPVAGHVAVFEDVQQRLQDVLASIDHEDPPDRAAEARQDPGGRPHD
jgi:hypothetical protein